MLSFLYLATCIIYYELDKELQMRSDFLELRVTSLAKRKMNEQAEDLIMEAKEFHQLGDETYPEFIYSIQKLISTDETIKFLSIQYDRIFRNSPEDLIRIIPTKSKTLADFILDLLISAASDMLDCINSISNVRYEDKYSDLMLLSLNGRLKNLYWHATNIRAGYSDSDLNNPGEIDFAIISNEKERLAICEALNLSSDNKREIQTHNLKVFNYDHHRNLFFLVVYYTGGQQGFLPTWEKYKKAVTEYVEFPEGFAIKNGLVRDINVPKGGATIQVGKSLHGKTTSLVHLFININYKVVTTAKKSQLNK